MNSTFHGCVDTKEKLLRMLVVYMQMTRIRLRAISHVPKRVEDWVEFVKFIDFLMNLFYY
jgi:hypothetical protein